MKDRIRILVTSDVHGYCFPYDYADGTEKDYGFARLSTLIKLLKDENTLVIDNGDNLEGSPLAYYHYRNEPEEVSPMSIAMKHIGYDYINLGNHDFDRGEDALFTHLRYVSAPCITSNALYRGKTMGPTYVIREIAGKKVALFGIITHHVPEWVNPRTIKHMRFQDAYETAKKTVDILKRLEKPDVIICVYHGGFERDLETGYPIKRLDGENQGYEILKNIPDIDVLIAGHQHRTLYGNAFGKAYVQINNHGRELACVDLYTDTNTTEIQVLQADTEPDEELLEKIRYNEERCQKWLDQPLGQTKIDLAITDPVSARLDKSQVITFLNKMFMELTGAQIASNSLFLDATGFHHQITMRDIINTYVFPDTIVVKEITGSILREYLERCAEFWSVRNEKIVISKAFEEPAPKYYNYDMADGVEYTITVSNDPGHRITSLTYNGEEVQDDQVFTIALNNFRASGGSSFTMLKPCKTIQEIRTDVTELLADYIRKNSPIDFEPVHNIRIIK